MPVGWIYGGDNRGWLNCQAYNGLTHVGVSLFLDKDIEILVADGKDENSNPIMKIIKTDKVIRGIWNKETDWPSATRLEFLICLQYDKNKTKFTELHLRDRNYYVNNKIVSLGNKLDEISTMFLNSELNIPNLFDSQNKIENNDNTDILDICIGSLIMDLSTGRAININFIQPFRSLDIDALNISALGIRRLINFIIPIGFIYVQYKDQLDPASLFGGNWSNISNEFAGLYFRSEGGNAATFGSNQSQGLPNITGSFCNILYQITDKEEVSLIEKGCFTNPNIGGAAVSITNIKNISGNDGIGFDASKSNSIYGTSSEVRTSNSTIRIWKRIG